MAASDTSSGKSMDIADVLSIFPPVQFAMAYGSGVFRQIGYTDKDQPMIDLVFGVDEPLQWHAANLSQNPRHYSGIGKFGASTIVNVQENYGAAMYYNTLVPLPAPFNKQLIKYGVISTANLEHDLRNWDTLYVSGRMQKPVRILRSTPELDTASAANLEHAVAAALLHLPESFTDEELFIAIARISYAGDFRMLIGEHPRKVQNIVNGSLTQFRQLYTPVLDKFSPYVSRAGNSLQQDVSPAATCSLAKHHLPMSLQRLMAQQQFSSHKATTGLLWTTVERVPEAHRHVGWLVEKALGSIVARHARGQSIKGIATAGVVKSSIYIMQKLTKWQAGLRAARAAKP